MKKKALVVILLFLGATLSLGALFGIQIFLQRMRADSSGAKVRVGGASFSVEIADTDESRSLGLGGREGICDTCGMFFLFDRPGKYAFWMKDMLFPLDIVWILDGRVVHIERNVDFHDQRTVYRPEERSDSVLEVRSGTCDRWNIREGSDVVFVPSE